MNRWIASAAAGFALVFASHAAMAQPAQPPQSLKALYSVSAKGLTAGEFNFDLTLDAGAYTASATRRMTGFVRTLVGDAQDYRYATRGRITALGLKPTAYEHQGGKKDRLVRVAFSDGHPTTTAVPEMGMGDPPATRAEKQGSIDQLTAIAAMVTGGANPCAGTLKVLLDGRSRFDFAMSGSETITARTRAYRGSALRCRVAYRPIAGFSDPQEPATLTFLFAQGESGLNVPIRIEMPTDDVGVAILEIKSFEVR